MPYLLLQDILPDAAASRRRCFSSPLPCRFFMLMAAAMLIFDAIRHFAAIFMPFSSSIHIAYRHATWRHFTFCHTLLLPPPLVAAAMPLLLPLFTLIFAAMILLPPPAFFFFTSFSSPFSSPFSFAVLRFFATFSHFVISKICYKRCFTCFCLFCHFIILQMPPQSIFTPYIVSSSSSPAVSFSSSDAVFLLFMLFHFLSLLSLHDMPWIVFHYLQHYCHFHIIAAADAFALFAMPMLFVFIYDVVYVL